jgi:hypothetical protein
MLSSKSSRYPNAYPNLRHSFCICIREHLNLYSYSCKNVAKGVIWIWFHAYLICFHPNSSFCTTWYGYVVSVCVARASRSVCGEVLHLHTTWQVLSLLHQHVQLLLVTGSSPFLQGLASFHHLFLRHRPPLPSVCSRPLTSLLPPRAEL